MLHRYNKETYGRKLHTLIVSLMYKMLSSYFYQTYELLCKTIKRKIQFPLVGEFDASLFLQECFPKSVSAKRVRSARCGRLSGNFGGTWGLILTAAVRSFLGCEIIATGNS